MALNEHKNLDEANLHNPKGFSTASNNTVLTKNSGGAVEWLPTANTGFGQVNFFDIQGYATTPVEGELYGFYEYPQQITDGQSPFELNQDYGASTISGATTISRSVIMRTGSIMIPSNTELSKLTGFLTCNQNVDVYIALVKVTFTDNEITDLPFTKLVEVSATANGNTRTMAVSATTFDEGTLAAGDLIFPMVKTPAGSGAVVYFHLGLQGVITI